MFRVDRKGRALDEGSTEIEGIFVVDKQYALPGVLAFPLCARIRFHLQLFELFANVATLRILGWAQASILNCTGLF
jgi:hypothetical protein